MNRRHTDRPGALSDYAFWAMALSYIGIKELAAKLAVPEWRWR